MSHKCKEAAAAANKQTLLEKGVNINEPQNIYYPRYLCTMPYIIRFSLCFAFSLILAVCVCRCVCWGKIGKVIWAQFCFSQGTQGVLSSDVSLQCLESLSLFSFSCFTNDHLGACRKLKRQIVTHEIFIRFNLVVLFSFCTSTYIHEFSSLLLSVTLCLDARYIQDCFCFMQLCSSCM